MREIQTQDWSAFCDRLNQFEDGATVDIHWIDRETKIDKEIAHAAQFREITFGRRDGCSDQITIRAGGEAGSGTRHDIVEPIHILLREVGDGNGFDAMAVEAEEGTTLMTFHPVIRSTWLEGLKL